MINFSQTDVDTIMHLVIQPYVYPDMLAEVIALRDKLDELLDDMKHQPDDYDLDDVEGFDFDGLDLGDDDDDW